MPRDGCGGGFGVSAANVRLGKERHAEAKSSRVMAMASYGDQCGGGSGVSRAEVGLGTERQGTERHAEVKSCAKSCVNGLLNVCHSAHETNSRWNVSSVSFTLFMKTVLAGMCRTCLSLCS